MLYKYQSICHLVIFNELTYVVKYYITVLDRFFMERQWFISCSVFCNHCYIEDVFDSRLWRLKLLILQVLPLENKDTGFVLIYAVDPQNTQIKSSCSNVNQAL